MSTSFHEQFDREEHVSRSGERAFGFLFAAVFAIVGFAPLFSRGEVRPWALGLAAVFALAAALFPAALRPLNALWLRFGLLLHAVVSPIILGALFYLTVVPLGLLMRALGKDLLRLRRDPAAASYWIPRGEGAEAHSMKNQF